MRGMPRLGTSEDGSGVVEAGEERLGGRPPAEVCNRSLGLSPGCHRITSPLLSALFFSHLGNGMGGIVWKDF